MVRLDRRASVDATNARHSTKEVKKNCRREQAISQDDNARLVEERMQRLKAMQA